jgi:hypothetical protein
MPRPLEDYYINQTQFALTLRPILRSQAPGVITRLRKEIKIREDTISGWSMGRLSAPKPKTIDKLAAALGLSEDQRRALHMAAAIDRGYDVSVETIWKRGPDGKLAAHKASHAAAIEKHRTVL